MASRFWNGVNNDWNDTTNWSATRGGATGQTVPGSSDAAYIYDGAGDITANITGVTPLTITIGGNFQGNITGMTCATAACVVTIETVATGKSIAIGAAASTTLAQIDVRSTGSGTVTIIGGASSVLTLLTAGGTGTLIIDGSAPITTATICGMTTRAAYNSTAFTALNVHGGSQPHTLQRSATTITLTDGAQVYSEYTGANPAFTTANLYSGAALWHDSAGTIGTLNAYPRSTLQPRATKFAVTTCNLYERANVNRNSDKITFSTVNTFGQAA